MGAKMNKMQEAAESTGGPPPKQPLPHYAAEFLGTFMLVFTVGLTQTVGATPKDEPPNASTIFGPTSIACVLMVMVWALGPISGGHFNPAVSFAALLQNELLPKDAVAYMIVQLAAGFCAAMVTGFMYEFGHTKMGPNDSMGDGVWIGAPIIEFLYTFMLCFVVLNTAMASKTKANNYYGIAIGFVIIAGGYGGGAVSGGAFNPAVALGVNFMSLNWNVIYCPIYMASELAGAFFAVIFFQIVRKEDAKKTHMEYNKVEIFLREKITKRLDAEDTCELVGTFMLCLTWALNGIVAQKNKDWGNPAAAWSIAASLMCMIYAVGDVSGGLFNPAVTVAVLGRYYKTGQGIGEKEFDENTGAWVYKRIADPVLYKSEALKYLTMQAIGGVAGAACSFFVTWHWPPGAAIATGTYLKKAPDGTMVPEHWGLGSAFCAELLGTFLLCYVVLSVALTKQMPGFVQGGDGGREVDVQIEGAPGRTEKRLAVKEKGNEYAPFAIGACIIAGGYGFGPLSGGVLNPAITLANGIFQLSLFTTAAPVLYFLAQVLGGVAAALFYKFLSHTDEFDNDGSVAPANNPIPPGARG